MREITLVLDPRFPGGTSSAVARELYALSKIAHINVVGLYSNMFKGKDNNPHLDAAFEDLGIEPVYNPDVVNSDTVVIHNPSFLKFNSGLETRFVCNRMVTVAHENFLRPNGREGFDVSGCLSLIEKNTLAREYLVAPVSGYNRSTVEAWLAENAGFWRTTEFNWFNICDFALLAPTNAPTDRRGRLSRAGFEKFPDLPTMERLFPRQADYCGILGADTFRTLPATPEHWDLYNFREIPVEQFLEKIDFFIYFTHPNLQESFGRVIAEAIAAGKPVITDPKTAQTFGDAVIPASPADVDRIISGLIAAPERYQRHVREAQHALTAFSQNAFTSTLSQFLNKPHEATFDFM